MTEVIESHLVKPSDSRKSGEGTATTSAGVIAESEVDSNRASEMAFGTAARRRLLRQLIEKGEVTNQLQARKLLADEGHRVTQATVSRDLAKLGAVKTNQGEYRISPRPQLPENLQQLGISLGQLAYSITSAGHLVVIRTPPGAAQMLAGEIDRARLEGILGTVAGDDTILVVAARDGAGLARRLEQL